MILRRPRPSIDDDPGDAWVDALLEPLRRAEVRCEVAPVVMARLAASRTAARPAVRRPRLVWVSGGLAALAALAVLALPLVGVARQGGLGMQQARAIANASGQFIAYLAYEARTLAGAVRVAALPLLRALVTLLEAAAPIFKSAGAVAALTGVLSIVISLYVFTHARGTAPPAGARSGYLPHGGMR